MALQIDSPLQETNFDSDNYECLDYSNKSTTIQEFYENQSIFITGGTGFIGKILIEKLLRCCSGISRIYILIRTKKDKDAHERIQNLLKDTVFEKVRSCVPNFEKKLVGLAGDCSLENLGLSEHDINLLKKDVSIIFHSAATVRFYEKMKLAVATNIQSTITITNFCKDMKNLKAFIYVSTAFAHCLNNRIIEEKFYDYSIDFKYLSLIANSSSEEILEAITPILIRSWLNTYTCTKALAENFLKTENQNLPIAIFRPAIVTPSAYEPLTGWVDNYNGSTGIIAGVTSGLLQTLHCDPNKRANLVPVDFTVNALIASAWDVATQTTRRGKNMLIYNYTSARESPITWNKILELGLKYNKQYPFSQALWYSSFRLTKYEFMYKFYRLFLHSIPAYLIDLVAQSIGQKPRLGKLYDKAHKMCDLTDYVTINEWDINNENVQSLWNKLDSNDRRIFQFTMRAFDWDKYICTYIKGIRIYLFKDDLKTLEASRARYQKLFYMDKVLRAIIVASIYLTLRKILEVRRRYRISYYERRCQYT